MSIKVTNKSKRAISIPLPGGKKLFIGPGKSGQIGDNAPDHPPLAKLIESGDLEIDAPGRDPGSAGTSSKGARSDGAAGGGGSGKSNIRRTGDR